MRPPRGAALVLGLLVHVGASRAEESPRVLAQLDPEGLENLEEQTETTPSGDEDVTETIGAPTPGPVEVVEAEPSEPAEAANVRPASRVQVSGFVRQSLELVYGELRQENLDPNPPLLWRDAMVTSTQLQLRASYLEGRHFEATISGVLGYRLHIATEAPRYSVGVVDLVRGDVEPELRDAYLGFFSSAVDLRIGQQRVAWGRADFQSPNDVVNARDLRDPFLGETELRYLPTPIVRASASAGVFMFEAVVSPFFVPDRFNVYGSNWSALQRHSSDAYRYRDFVGSLSTLVDASIGREFEALWHQTELPQNNGKGIAAGARISASFAGTDVNAYYHYGYDSTPAVQMHSRFLDYLSAADYAAPPSERLNPLLRLAEELGSQGEGLFSARYLRRHHVGFDLATGIGPFALRLDTAFQTRRVFYQPDLTSFTSPTLLGVASIEYQTGSLDELILIELIGARLLEEPTLPLIGYQRDTLAVAGTLRWTLGGPWGIDLRGLVGAAPQSHALQPALRYKPNDTFTLRLGALLLSGETNSLGWYFSDNDSAFVQVRYGF